jgi:tetratricopeptide (TPR) repeat protein
MDWDIPRKQFIHLCVGIVALLWLVYALSLSNGFVALDDGLLILKNGLVQRMSPYTIGHIFTSYDPELYIPFTLFFYQILYAVAGPSSVVFHTASLLLHTVNTLLLVWVLTQLSSKRWLGVLGGIFFAVHPIHTEAVAWASATKDLLSAMFCLLSFGLYLQFLREKNTKYLRYSTLAFACSLFSKVVPILLPFVLLLTDHAKGRSVSRKTIYEKRWFFVLSIIFGAVALAGKSGNPQMLHSGEIVLMACKSMIFTLQKLLLPTGLSVIHPQLSVAMLASAEFFVPVAFTLAFVCLFLWSYHSARNLCLSLGMFLLFLAPNFSNFSKNGYIFFASERYAYLPSIGIFLLIVLAAEKLACSVRTRKIVVTLTIITALPLAYLTNRQSLTWKDSESMYRNILALYPGSTMALNNLGGELMNAQKTEEAHALFMQSYEKNENSISATNIGLLKLNEGEISEAKKWFSMAIIAIPTERKPTTYDLVPYYLLASVLEQASEPEGALELYQEAARLGSSLAEPHINLGIAYQKRTMRKEAEAAFRKAIAINASLPAPHYHLAGILAETGYLQEAEQELRTVLQIHPQYENAQRHLEGILQITPTR